MCGIVGFLDKSGADGKVGHVVLDMLNALSCRGPDSAGVAIYGQGQPSRLIVRVKLGEAGDLTEIADRVQSASQRFGAADFEQTGSYLRMTIACAEPRTVRCVTDAVEAVSADVEVVSMGTSLEIVKQVGSPANLEATFGISNSTGSHGLGHTRLSTESKVDLSHSQPFWAHGRPDLAIAHNGHITNYHQLRRRYEQSSVRFYTENDSEVVAIYLAKQLEKGGGLQTAFENMMRDLDGSFSCLAATESEMGFIKDPFAFKPLLFAEADGFVAVATEEIAIRAALPGKYQVNEAQVREARVWRRC